LQPDADAGPSPPSAAPLSSRTASTAAGTAARTAVTTEATTVKIAVTTEATAARTAATAGSTSAVRRRVADAFRSVGVRGARSAARPCGRRTIADLSEHDRVRAVDVIDQGGRNVSTPADELVG
jgi:hypothetical protein